VLDFGRDLADACGASLHLLHVVGFPWEDSRALAQARQPALRRLDAALDGVDR
jgi:hypothetical protein